MSLKKQAISGLFWTFGQQFGVQAINFFVQIILARLLLPEVFGLIAMIQVFIAIGKTLLDGGMTSSLIRTKNADQKDYSTVFFINLISSILIYLVLFFSAPVISTFFEQPILISIIRVYTISFIIQAFVGVQVTRLTKDLNFKLQMYMQIPATICGGITGVLLALYDYGVWSIVWMNLITTILFMLQIWFKTGWRPDFIIDKSKLKYHINFGYKLTLSGLLTNIYVNSYALIVGKLFSPTQLGFYNQANTMRMYPVSNLTITLQKVTYPIFSLIQDDDERLKDVFRKITSMVFFVITPVLFYLALIAEPLFRFFLTEKWLPSVSYFQFLAISSIVYPLSLYNLNIILVKGRSDLHLKMELIKKLISISFLLLIIPFGIWGAVYAQALGMLIHAFVNAFFCGRLIKYPVRKQIIDLLPIFLVSCFVLIITYYIDIFFVKQFIGGDILRISVNFAIYFSFYFISSKLLGFNALTELIILGKNGVSKIKQK